MKLKKCNAILSLILTGLFLVHAFYQTISYVAFYYNPVLSKALAYSLLACMCAHAVLACISVCGRHDSQKIAYPKLNMRTVLQRASAAAAVILLLFHVFSFAILTKTAGSIFYYVGEALQLAFIGAMFLHVAVSFSKAFITLGLVGDEKKIKIIDIVCAVLCAVLFSVMSIVIALVHLKIFAG